MSWWGNLDVRLAMGIAAISALLALMGVGVTLAPPTSRRAKGFWAVGFLLIAAVGCVLTSWQASRSVAAGEELDRKLNSLKPPTAADNARAILALQQRQQPQTASAVPATAPRPKAKVPNKPTQEAPAAPQNQLASAAPTVAQFAISQTPEISDNQDAPYKTRVVIQTNTTFPSLRLAVECDAPVEKEQLQTSGVFFMPSDGIVEGHPNVFVFTYGSTMGTPFSPSNPMVFFVWSREPIRCTHAALF